MVDRSHALLRSVLDGLAAGSEPESLLRDGLAGALAATGATDGAVLRLSAGELVPVVTSGRLGEVALATATAAAEAARMVRRRDAASGLTTAAEPLRAGLRVLGVVVVAGLHDRIDASSLSLYASALAAVVQRHATAVPEALPELLESLSTVARDLDVPTMSARILEAARDLFGVDASLCALDVDGVVRVTHFRGIDADRLARAAQFPGFRPLVTGDRVRVDGPDDPVVACLDTLGRVAVGLPLAAGGKVVGRLVLLMPEAPARAGLAVLDRFASHVAMCLLAGNLERAVRDQEQRLSSVAHSVGQPVVMVDEGGRLVEVNAAAAQVFRMAAGFERGQPVAGRLGHDVLEQMLASGVESSREVVVGTGETHVYRATVRRLRGAGSRAAGCVLVLDDVTTARRTDAIQADFVAVIGHELRTPITVMKGYLKTLARRGDAMSPERRAQALAAVDGSVTRLERLIEDLLFVSAVDEHTAVLDIRETDLRGLLLAEATERVVVHVPATRVEAGVDDARFAQVVRHLLDNALQHSTGEVVVRLTERGGTAEVAVEDCGPGIFSGDVPQLFERFRQLDGSSTRPHGGVGMGLYICRRIVEAMGGRIWCESRLGVGSRFVFSLPAVTGAIQHARVS